MAFDNQDLKCLCFFMFYDEWEPQISGSQLFLFENVKQTEDKQVTRDRSSSALGLDTVCPLAMISTGTTSPFLASDLPSASDLSSTISPPQLGGLQDFNVPRALSSACYKALEWKFLLSFCVDDFLPLVTGNTVL